METFSECYRRGYVVGHGNAIHIVRSVNLARVTDDYRIGYEAGKNDANDGLPCLHTDPWADEIATYDATYNDLYGDGDPSNILA